MKINTRVSALAAAISAQFLLTSPTVLAQEANVEKKEDIEMIMVTGSFVRRSENFESPSPLSVVDSVAIDALGAKTSPISRKPSPLTPGLKITQMHSRKTPQQVLQISICAG